MRNASGRLELDRPNQGRLDAVYNAPWGLSAGLQFYVRTGVPTSKSGYYNGFYTTELYLDQRGYAGRLPTDYEMNLSLGYNLNVGPVTITPMFYAFQLLNRQTATAVDTSVQPERVVRRRIRRAPSTVRRASSRAPRAPRATSAPRSPRVPARTTRTTARPRRSFRRGSSASRSRSRSKENGFDSIPGEGRLRPPLRFRPGGKHAIDPDGEPCAADALAAHPRARGELGGRHVRRGLLLVHGTAVRQASRRDLDDLRLHGRHHRIPRTRMCPPAAPATPRRSRCSTTRPRSATRRCSTCTGTTSIPP